MSKRPRLTIAPKHLLLAVACIAVALALTIGRPHTSPGPAMRDFEAYYCAGVTSNDGADPYSRRIWECERRIPGVDATHDEMLPFVGPPPVLVLFRTLALLPYDAARIAWYVTLLACAGVLSLVPILTLRDHRSKLEAVAIAAIACVSFAPLTSDLALGQIAIFAAAGVALASVARPLGKCAAFLLSSVQPNVGIASAAALRDRASLFSAASAVLIFYACGVPYAGVQWPFAYARTLAGHAAAERTSVIQHTVTAVLAAFGLTPLVALALHVLLALAAVLFIVWIARKHRQHNVAVAAACVAVPFIASFFHEHDFCVLLFAAIVALGNSSRPVIAFAGALLVAVDWLGLAQRPEAAMQAALLLVAFASVALALRRLPLRDSAFALGSIALLFAAGVAAGATHRVAIWPDALGPYRAPAHATIAQVWSQEQERSHQTQGTAFDAAARAMPLLGCALLGVALRYRRP